MLSRASLELITLASGLGPPPRAVCPALRTWALNYGVRPIPRRTLVIGAANLLVALFLITLYLSMSNTVSPTAREQMIHLEEQAQQRLAEQSRQPGLAPETQRALLQTQRQIADDLAWRKHPHWLLWAGIAWIALDLFGFATAFFIQEWNARPGRRLLALLRNGQVGIARVVASQLDYTITRRGAPRRLLQLDIDGHSMQIKTFDQHLADLFPCGAVLEVLYVANVRDMVFPTSAIPALCRATYSTALAEIPTGTSGSKA